MKRVINRVVIHCSASDNPKHDNIDTIRRWHLQQGWDDVGYNFFIRFNGTMEIGRDIEIIPAHVSGLNEDSLGICLSGNKYFAQDQFDTCKQTIHLLKMILPRPFSVHGHHEFNKKKTCPNFDIKKEILNE